jgi:LPPG:FO 2-phospho-L-lactate transferase
MVTVLVGGVGGSKLALGVTRILAPDECALVVNTADDLEWHGLYVAPDIDTVLYTLGGIADPETGWGVEGDTTVVLEGLARYGFEPWFRIGDRDLATHIARTEWFRSGLRYTGVVLRLAEALGIKHLVLPMSDKIVRTIVHTTTGDLEFQEYFLTWQSVDRVTGFTFAGIDTAAPSAEVLVAVQEADVILLGPSNPFVSIGPILALRGMRDLLRQTEAPVVAVSPIVGGRALKGPASRMLQDLGYPSSATAVAGLYADFLDGFVMDVQNAELAAEAEALGMETLVTDTVMTTLEDRERVAHETIAFARGLGGLA